MFDLTVVHPLGPKTIASDGGKRWDSTTLEEEAKAKSTDYSGTNRSSRNLNLMTLLPICGYYLSP